MSTAIPFWWLDLPGRAVAGRHLREPPPQFWLYRLRCSSLVLKPELRLTLWPAASAASTRALNLQASSVVTRLSPTSTHCLTPSGVPLE